VPISKEQRRRRERFWVVLVLMLTSIFGFLEGWFFQLQSDLPLFGNVLLFALINLNVILLLLLTYLLLRNIVKLIFERKRNILGHKLRTRLVCAFVGLTLIPTLPLFWLATQFIFSSIDYWFSRQVEQSLEQSVNLAKDYLEQEGRNLVFDCEMVAKELRKHPWIENPSNMQAEQPSASLPDQYHLDGLFFFDANGDMLCQMQSSRLPPVDPESLHDMVTKESASPSNPQTITFESKESKQDGLFTYLPFPPFGEGSQEKEGLLIVLRLLPAHITGRLAAISTGYEDYLQLKLLHNPLKISHFMTFSIVTLLVIFAAIWFAFFLAKSITVPIQAMVSATQRIADGDLNVQLDSDRSDEVGMLMASFNHMVRDLRESREQLANAYYALKQSHVELEDRRRYMEIVLKNIAAGVVSVDASGRIMTMNKSAEETFGLQAEETKGRLYSEFLQPPHLELVKCFMTAYRMGRSTYLEQQAQVMMGNRPMVLLVKVSVLRDENDQYMGVVVVLDDLTELEKAQRMAAWREVARRIAHEIKNPLTPIQLSAQRIRRKHPELVEARDSIFDECTRTIIQQVDHMKHLVNEFSRFARLPHVQLAPCDLPSIVEESLALYQHTFPHAGFKLERNGEFPLLKLDREQFKQVMINLFDNALYALDSEQGAITVRLFHDPILKIARLECADSGHGISPEDKLRMFEPYYSTKEKGTGLGLAIVASIVADHNGFIRVRDNVPAGTVIIIELPG